MSKIYLVYRDVKIKMYKNVRFAYSLHLKMAAKHAAAEPGRSALAQR